MNKCGLKSPQQVIVLLCVAVCVGYMIFEARVLKDFRYPQMLRDYDFVSHIRKYTPPKIGQDMESIKLRSTNSVQTQYDGVELSGVLDDYEAEDQMPKKKMRAVVIVASYRTGSSFIGQLFNQHPDVFYLFEPLFFSNWPRIQGHPVDKVVEDLLLCKMNSMRDEIRHAHLDALQNFRKQPTFILRKRLRQTEVCMEKSLCFRGKSKAICTREMCRNISSTECQSCPAPSPDMMRKACLNAEVRVIKVIRIEDLMTLKRAWNHPDIDLKIIHLVRDPRPTLLSRLKLRRTEATGKIVEATCRRNVRIQKQYLTNETEFKWLEGIYKLVRYEDVIENPLLFAEKLYDFINYESFIVNSELKKWVQSSTKSTDHNLFGTSRDVSQQKLKWRTQLSMAILNDVQETCKDMMSLFGYKSIGSRTQLYNFTDSLLVH
uniref:carbohydrate sulfotransferase 1-like n=1 Tax=Styela clava TaxID=7725 RepID=UPI00193AB53C|nr:carbohydrate sulfotransferase 1-like [Styela clava]